MKLPFHNGWVQWKMNDLLYGARKTKDDVCTFNFKKTNDNVASYYDELLNNARMMRDYYSDPFDVLYSGGIDSEVIIRAFKDLGIKHNTIIVRYNDGYNKREIDCALELVKGMNIPYKIIDFDIKKFFENDAYDWCIKSSCLRVGRVNHVKFCVDFCDNIPVMGEGDVYWHRSLESDYSKKSDWKFVVGEANHTCNMFLTSIGKENVCDFYEFTPNLIKAYNNLPIIKRLLDDRIPGKHSNWSSKWLIHKEIWPDMKQRVKLTGLEKDAAAGTMPDFVSELQETILKELGQGNDYWYTKEELDRLI